jgi:hypothetical protein
LTLWKDKQDWWIFSYLSKGRGPRLTELDTKKETSEQMTKNSRGSLRNILKTYTLIDWKIYKRGLISKFIWPTKTEQRRYKTCKQNYYNQWNLISNNDSPNKSPIPNGFNAEFYQNFKEKLLSVLRKPFHKMERERTVTNSRKPLLSW